MGRDRTAAAKAAAAQSAFCSAAWAALPDTARRALFTLSPDQIDQWARQWRIDAPCMIHWARELHQASVDDPEFVDRLCNAPQRVTRTWSAPPAPPNWIAELRRLDALPATCRATGCIDEEVPLAPPAADPWTETKKAYLQRAEEHFLARQRRLYPFALQAFLSEQIRARLAAGVMRPIPKPDPDAATGEGAASARSAAVTVHPPAATPQLLKHVAWLIRFQMHGESPAAIAKRADLHGPEQRVTVRKAIHALASVIDLPLRKAQPGRPRRQAATPPKRKLRR